MPHDFNDFKQSHLTILNGLAKDIWAVLERYEDSIPVASVLGVLEAIKYEVINTAIEVSERGEDDFDD